MKQLLLVLYFFGGFSALVSAADAPALPVEISPDDAHILYTGRFDTRDAKGPRCAWSASSAALRFNGTAANVKLAPGNNQFQIIVDGAPAKVLVPEKGQIVYELAAALPQGEHVVEVFKRTEASAGVAQFMGFQLSAGAKVLEPVKPARVIEVIGDSISCGYGNEGKNQNEHFKNDTENAYLTYGAIAARALNARYVCVAWSGKKMWPNNTIPELYDLTLPYDGTSKWDFSKLPADAVVINLATNDFGGKANPDEQGWCAAYKKFVQRVRKNYPLAVIYCASSPMMSDQWPAERKAASTLKRYLDSVIDDLKKDGDSNVHFMPFASQNMKDGLGSDWHPSVKTHEIMAAKMVEVLKKDLK